MVKIRFLGGCREIGASGVLIQSEKSDNSLLIDYGIRLQRKKNILPLNIDDVKLSAIALSHCHIDHSGNLPSLYANRQIPLYINELTYRIISVLIRDTLKISKYKVNYTNRELNKMGISSYFIDYGIRQRIGHDFFLTFKDAGHVPGSCSVLVEVDGKKILYTGDINTQNTKLVNNIKPLEFSAIDALIIESTYALRDHKPREEIEREFIENVNLIVEDKGRVLIPAFGVARSQEILYVLHHYGFQGHIYLDGMGRKISEIYYDYSKYLRNPREFQKAVNNAIFILDSRAKRDRKSAKKNPGVIISTSGMLQGGPARSYAKSIIHELNSAIYSVGYQVENTPGRILLDEHMFFESERDLKGVKAVCDIKNFDFSSHAGASGLRNFVDNLKFNENSSKEIFCMHGDSESCTIFAKDLNKKGYSAISPETGDIFTI
jgi:putative mRNA 3-end processing factor